MLAAAFFPLKEVGDGSSPSGLTVAVSEWLRNWTVNPGIRVRFSSVTL